jgi:hypothetical protein
MENEEYEHNIPSWIHHFEKQAKIGISSRSSFNNKVIIIPKIKNRQEKSTSSKIKQEIKIPDIVSPLQQVVEQAEEEIKREEVDKSEQIENKYQDRKTATKRKRTIKGRITSKKFKDIFT